MSVSFNLYYTYIFRVYEVRLRKQILSEHDVIIYHWTDSSTVLQCLQAAHNEQYVFVVNRAEEMLEISSMDQWRQVKGVKNPAVIGTRGMSMEGLKESLWLNLDYIAKHPTLMIAKQPVIQLLLARAHRDNLR